jgi:hypothetical protein
MPTLPDDQEMTTVEMEGDGLVPLGVRLQERGRAMERKAVLALIDEVEKEAAGGALDAAIAKAAEHLGLPPSVEVPAALVGQVILRVLRELITSGGHRSP